MCGRISCCLMGSGLVLCKYVLQDGLWDFLTCIPLSCSLQALMENFRTSNPMSICPPPPPYGYIAICSSHLFFRYDDHYTLLVILFPELARSADFRGLEMDMLETLLVVTRDDAPFYEHNHQPVQKKRRCTLCPQSVQTRGNSERVLMGIMCGYGHDEEVMSPVKVKPDGSVPGPDSGCASDSSDSDF